MSDDHIGNNQTLSGKNTKYLIGLRFSKDCGEGPKFGGLDGSIVIGVVMASMRGFLPWYGRVTG